ncbi:MAG: LmeA family phospholipid-binding protein [Armatimonadota bacterium]|nr:LmeA family phospholipid-binding protein [Armatimonadota bacterium]MDR7533578.1 LmeA family phospholipid-binding protein [Armatimonadota bacterium]MDR7537378.1 LmeA family phospholipid-binding protein [Armatimonadota bacterium]
MRCPLAGGIALLVALCLGAPAAADDALLTQAFGTFLRRADVLRIEAIPDLYEGSYARITVTGRGVHLHQGPRVDEVMVRLVGVSLDPGALRGGQLKIVDYRGSALRVKVLLRSLQDHFNAGGVGDIRLWAEHGYLYGTGTVPFRGQPARLRMKGFFAVAGTTEVYFYFETLHANGLPVPTAVIRDLERQLNPILHQREWPVRFPLRLLRLDAEALLLSSEGDPSVPCPSCGGGPQTTYEP